MGFTKIMAGLSCNASLFHPLGQSHPLIVNNPRNRGFASDLFMCHFGVPKNLEGCLLRQPPKKIEKYCILSFLGIYYIK